MNQEQRNYNDMFVQTQRHLDTHPDKWTAVPAIVRYKNTLDGNLQAIVEKDLEANGQTKGLTITKNDLKNQLALKAAILCGAMYAYASETEDKKLLKRSEFSHDVLYKQPDRVFAQTVKSVLETGTGYLDKLVDQAVNQEQITEIATSLDDFFEMIGMPRTIVVQASTAGKELDQLVKETNDMLRFQLDKVMLRYKLSDPSFYEGYQRARTIVDN